MTGPVRMQAGRQLHARVKYGTAVPYTFQDMVHRRSANEAPGRQHEGQLRAPLPLPLVAAGRALTVPFSGFEFCAMMHAAGTQRTLSSGAWASCFWRYALVR